jgi:NTP pyrophosphatase (non-canonical NTP hydrolase)
MTHEIMYKPVSIPDLIEESHKTAIEHGWHEEDRNFGSLIALIHSELSEALEDYRNGRGFTEIYYKCKKDELDPCCGKCKQCDFNKPCGIPIELADTVIRIFDVCGKYGIDLEKAIVEKMNYNQTRPYKHGGKKI